MRNAGEPLPVIFLVAPDGCIKTKSFAENTGTSTIEAVPDGKGSYRGVLRGVKREQGWLTLEEAYQQTTRSAEVRKKGYKVYLDWSNAHKRGVGGRVMSTQVDGDRITEVAIRTPFPDEWLPDIVLERRGKRQVGGEGGWQPPVLEETEELELSDD